MRHLRHYFGYAAPLALLLLSTTGCFRVMESLRSSNEHIAPGTPQFTVQIIGQGWNKVAEHTLPLSEDMTINEVLEETKSKRKFRNMEIQIIRRVPGSSQPAKMSVHYRAGMKSVPAEQNYAIHADDFVVIKQIISTPIDRMVDNFLPFKNQ